MEPETEFVGVGGALMAAEGFPESYDMETLSVNGFFDPIIRLALVNKINAEASKRNYQQATKLLCRHRFEFFQPHAGRVFKEKGIKTIQYVSPSIWAWRQGRVKKSLEVWIWCLPFIRLKR